MEVDDNNDNYSCNFQARTSRFCMEVDQDNTCHMKMMKKMIIVMVMIIMLIISVTQSIFKQGDLYPNM